MPHKIKKVLKVYKCDNCGINMINEKGLCETCQDELDNYPIDEDEYPEDSFYDGS